MVGDEQVDPVCARPDVDQDVGASLLVQLNAGRELLEAARARTSLARNEQAVARRERPSLGRLVVPTSAVTTAGVVAGLCVINRHGYMLVGHSGLRHQSPARVASRNADRCRIRPRTIS